MGEETYLFWALEQGGPRNVAPFQTAKQSPQSPCKVAACFGEHPDGEAEIRRAQLTLWCPAGGCSGP